MRKTIWATAIGAAVVGGCAFAMANQAEPELDQLTVKERIGDLIDANTPAGKAEARFEARLAAQTKRELDVGDPDSFGKDVRWMGTISGPLINMRTSCEPAPGQERDPYCLQTATSDASTRYAQYRDVARMTLPPRSISTLLCHWLTPTVLANFENAASTPYVNGRVSVQPSLTIESEVLNDPSLIDPDTGEPFNGKFEVYASSMTVNGSPAFGQRISQRLTTTRACVGGYVNKRSMIEYYGLSEKQAKQFFNKPITLRLNMEVFASSVRDGGAAVAIRFVGD